MKVDVGAKAKAGGQSDGCLLSGHPNQAERDSLKSFYAGLRHGCRQGYDKPIQFGRKASAHY